MKLNVCLFSQESRSQLFFSAGWVMTRPTSKAKSNGRKLTTLIKTLSRRKSKAVSDQDEKLSLLQLPDFVLENILLQAHPVAALALGATCKHLHTELIRHQSDICLKLLTQPENQVNTIVYSDAKPKSKSSLPAVPSLGTYLSQRSYRYQMVVRNQWTVKSAEVLLHMLLTQQTDSVQVWTALLPEPELEKKMYTDCIHRCVGTAGIDPQSTWDVTLAIRVPVKLSQAEFDALVPGCQPFIRRVREQLAEVTGKSVEDLQLRILFESVNWYRVFRST